METYGACDITKKGFCSDVFANFEKDMGGTIRGYDAIVIKWKILILPKVAAFSVVYDSIQLMDENGSSDLVLFQNALPQFQTGYRHPFTMEKCLRILKIHAAWIEIEMPTYQRHKKTTQSNPPTPEKPPMPLISSFSTGGSSSQQHTHQPMYLISSFLTIEELADEHEICDEYLTDGYLTEQQEHQLRLDEEALKETLEEEAKAKKK
nr:hypothetical protein [Tanacetum cinerariifolium]